MQSRYISYINRTLQANSGPTDLALIEQAISLVKNRLKILISGVILLFFFLYFVTA